VERLEESMQRFASVIGLKESEIESYKKLHAAIWPEVARMIAQTNMRNYSIYLRQFPDGNYYLFSYFEYVGNDLKADMDRMAADAMTQEWWTYCHPCQIPLSNRGEGESWAALEEVFHQD
jgi:L-rhamnose mutarotase